MNDYFTFFYVKHFELPLCMKCAIQINLPCLALPCLESARPLIRQTCFPAVSVLLTSDYFVISKEYASGKCFGVKVYILTRKCSGVKVKVGRNIKLK